MEKQEMKFTHHRACVLDTQHLYGITSLLLCLRCRISTHANLIVSSTASASSQFGFNTPHSHTILSAHRAQAPSKSHAKQLFIASLRRLACERV